MRITGGALRGRTLATPADARVRPTADKVRQAIFNILAHHDFGTGFRLEGARVCDLFAGTGAMGVEALSRGAAFALFVEDSADSRALIRANVEALGLTGVTKIWRRDATRLGAMAPGAGGPFDLVFLDPPYRKGLIGPALAALRAGEWLSPGALAVAEAAEDEDSPSTDGFATLDERVYGDTRVRFMGTVGAGRAAAPARSRGGAE
ncbi:MAG TPA: 16S rRNA (guanine(966)-N(2))-methyltransferase RsmD [Rhizomicrobium sp.]|nr:16S rRNA (guanine(966)-N(2))-methyltransferase RsmD [Rhizomicrobium sp.]